MSEIKVNKVSSRTGNAVTLGTSGDTFTVPSGVTITNSGTATGFKDTQWQSVKTSSFTAVAGEGYFINTTGGAITMTLPASPSLGDTIQVRDYAGTFGSNAVTINVNGNKLAGTAANGSLATSNLMAILVYSGSDKGWLATENEAKSNVIPASYTEATGGTVATSGDYKIHTFNSSSNFVVSSTGNAPSNPAGGPNSVDYLIVAGGGGGGGNDGGGGGAGGFRESKSPVAGTYTASPLASPTALTISTQTYPVTVGAGGTAGTPGGDGGAGGVSTFSTITSAGGAGGKSESGLPNNGNAGGSGSGASAGGGTEGTGGSGNTPPVSPPQGSNGGNSYNPGGGGATPPNRAGGGGGGASAVGANATNAAGGNGGAGVTTNITASPLTFAGGGGGGGRSSGGSAGSSLGGNGTSASGSAGAGTANRGAGGGGAGEGATASGAGGSGIVVLRYKYQN